MSIIIPAHRTYETANDKYIKNKIISASYSTLSTMSRRSIDLCSVSASFCTTGINLEDVWVTASHLPIHVYGSGIIISHEEGEETPLFDVHSSVQNCHQMKSIVAGSTEKGAAKSDKYELGVNQVLLIDKVIIDDAVLVDADEYLEKEGVVVATADIVYYSLNKEQTDSFMSEGAFRLGDTKEQSATYTFDMVYTQRSSTPGDIDTYMSSIKRSLGTGTNVYNDVSSRSDVAILKNASNIWMTYIGTNIQKLGSLDRYMNEYEFCINLPFVRYPAKGTGDTFGLNGNVILIKSIKIDIKANAYSVGDSEKEVIIGEEKGRPFLYDTGGFIYSGTKQDTMANKIINQYKDGKEVVELKCSVADYYDENGNLAVDSKLNSGAGIFDIGDVVRPMVLNEYGKEIPMSVKADGTPKDFTVSSVTIDFDGGLWQTIIAREKTV